MGEKCSFKHQVQLPDSSKDCKRLAIRDGLCIGHLPFPSKDVNQFKAAYEEELLRPDFANFVGFFFPSELAPSLCKKIFDKPIFFDYAVFDDDPRGAKGPYFYGCEFRDRASFRSARFNGKTWFSKSIFLGDAHFSGAITGTWPFTFDYAIFEGSAVFGRENDSSARIGMEFNARVSFEYAEFKGNVDFANTKFFKGVDFTRTKFLGGGEAIVQFYGTKIKNDPSGLEYVADLEFNETIFHTPTIIHLRTCQFNKVKFSYANLQNVCFSFLDLNDGRCEFHGTIEWPKQDDNLNRLIIYDEKIIESKKNSIGFLVVNPVRVVNAYKWLESFFYRQSDYSKATDCYVGAMTCRRHDPGYSKVYRVLNQFYKVFGNYGMSVTGPLAWLATMFLLAPFVLTFSGIQILNIPVTSICDYWKVFVSNIGLVLFAGRFNYAQPTTATSWAIVMIETFLTVVLIAFIVIASRRQFTPKKPLSED